MNVLLLKEDQYSVRYFFFGLLLLCSISIQAQKGRENIHPNNILPYVQDNNLGRETEDTIYVNELLNRLKSHVNQQVYLNLDSVRYWAQRIIPLARKLNHTSALLRTYEGYGWAFFARNFQDSARFYFGKALNIAMNECNYFRLSVDNLWFGWTYSSESNLDSALFYFQLAKDFGQEVQDTFLLSAASTQLTNAYIIKGDWVAVTEESFNQLNIAKISNDTGALITIYCTLGNIYGILGLNNQQMDMVNITMALSKDTVGLQNNDRFSYAQAMFNIYHLASEAYLNQRKYDSVLYYARLNLRFCHQLKMIPISWEYIANAYLNTNLLDSAKYYYTQYLKKATAQGIEIDPETYLGIGECEFKLGNLNKAHYYYTLAELKADSSSFLVQRNIYKNLYEYYNFQENYKKAIVYLENYRGLEDSIQNSQSTYNLGIATMKFDAFAMEGQIQLLTKEKELQSSIFSRQRQQKNIVYGSMAFLFVLGGFGFNRFRKYKNLKNKQALANERLRISRDLHDEVGSTLSGIVMYSHLAKGQAKAGKKEAAHSIGVVQETASEMVNKLNDVIWLTNPQQDHLDKLIGRLEEYAIKLGSARHINFNISIPEEIQQLVLPIEIRKNVYYICKEAIHNAIKYSEGSSLNLVVIQRDHTLEFSIRDNGKGFDPDSIKRGNGLTNMQKRAEEINVEYSCQSVEGKGTIITLICKIKP